MSILLYSYAKVEWCSKSDVKRISNKHAFYFIFYFLFFIFMVNGNPTMCGLFPNYPPRPVLAPPLMAGWQNYLFKIDFIFFSLHFPPLSPSSANPLRQ